MNQPTSKGSTMRSISLTTLAEEHLAAARGATRGRSAHRPRRARALAAPDPLRFRDRACWGQGRVNRCALARQGHLDRRIIGYAATERGHGNEPGCLWRLPWRTRLRVGRAETGSLSYVPALILLPVEAKSARSTATGLWAWRRSIWLTDPSNAPRTTPRPREPTTVSAAPADSVMSA